MSSLSQTNAADGHSDESSNQNSSVSVWLGQLWTTVSQFFFHISFETGAFLLNLLVRMQSRIKASALSFGRHMEEKARYWFAKTRASLRETGFAASFRRMREEYRAIWWKPLPTDAPGIAGEMKVKTFRPGAAVLFGLKYLWKLTATILNYVCPVMAIGVLIGTVRYFTSLPFVLSVEYDGKNIGYITDERIFDDAKQMMRDRMIYEEYQQPLDAVPKFTLCVADNQELSDSFTLADQIIQASGNEIIQADGLYIDDDFIGATTDGQSMMMLLESLKEPYLEEYPEAKVEFTSKIKVRQGLYPVSSVVELNNIEEYISSEVEGEKIYIAQAGDAPITIARSNGISLASLRELNPGIDTKLLIGQEVLISKSVPLLGVKATYTKTYTEEIPFKINKTPDSKYYSSYSKVVSTGENGLREVEEEVVYINGMVSERNIISTETLVEPVDQEVIVGAMTAAPSRSYSSYIPPSTPLSGGSAVSNGYIWPVGGSGGYVSCGLYGYWGHTGMDIAVSTGTPIYAVASGTVVVAQQRGGYGKYIVIDHGGGLQTWYLHSSALYVTPGQKVNQGQTIAAVGQTGNATGPHLHIEFRSYGSVKNPASYIGTR